MKGLSKTSKEKNHEFMILQSPQIEYYYHPNAEPFLDFKCHLYTPIPRFLRSKLANFSSDRDQDVKKISVLIPYSIRGLNSGSS